MKTVILFADVVGSTRLKSKVGFKSALTLIKKHNDIFSDALGWAKFENEEARVVKYMGDGVMARFDHTGRPRTGLL